MPGFCGGIGRGKSACRCRIGSYRFRFAKSKRKLLLLTIPPVRVIQQSQATRPTRTIGRPGSRCTKAHLSSASAHWAPRRATPGERRPTALARVARRPRATARLRSRRCEQGSRLGRILAPQRSCRILCALAASFSGARTRNEPTHRNSNYLVITPPSRAPQATTAVSGPRSRSSPCRCSRRPSRPWPARRCRDGPRGDRPRTP